MLFEATHAQNGGKSKLVLEFTYDEKKLTNLHGCKIA